MALDGRLSLCLIVLNLVFSALGAEESSLCPSKGEHPSEKEYERKAKCSRDIASAKKKRRVSRRMKYWAIDLAEPEWTVLRSEDGSTVLEENIKEYCKREQFFGFSFIDVRTKYPYISSSNKSSYTQVVFRDVFYACCSTDPCPIRKHEEDDNYIKELLATEFLRYTLNQSEEQGFYTEKNYTGYCINAQGMLEAKPPGVYACMLYMDVNNAGRLYAGPMMFNRIDLLHQTIDRVEDKATWLHLYENGKLCKTSPAAKGLADGECIHYVEMRDYFLICCCYENPLNCSYDPNYGSETARNFKEWQMNPELTSGIVRGKRYDNHVEEVSYNTWTMKDYMYSVPRKISGAIVRGIHNHRFIRCAFGDDELVYDHVQKRALKIKKRRLQSLPEEAHRRSQFCSTTFTLRFSKANKETPARYICMSKTISVLNLLNNVTKEQTICTRTFDYESKKEVFAVNGTSYYAPFTLRKKSDENSGTCYRQEGFPLKNMMCSQHFRNVTAQFVVCECDPNDNSSLKEAHQCDIRFSDFDKLPQKDLNPQPKCFSGRANSSVLSENGGNRIVDKFTIKETTDTPICFDEILLGKNELYYRSGTLTELVRENESSAKYYSSWQGKKRYIVSRLGSEEVKVQFLCQSNLSHICNGPRNIRLHLLPNYVAMSASEGYAKNSECPITIKSSTKSELTLAKCNGDGGCFSYLNRASGWIINDCLDNLPSLLKGHPEVRVALICDRKPKKDSCIETRDLASPGERAHDLLCCCRPGYLCELPEEGGNSEL